MWRLIAAVLLAFGWSLATGVLATAATRHSCGPPGAPSLAGNGRVRVFALPDMEGPPTVEACLAGHTGHMTLFSPGPRSHIHRSVARFELAGSIVAYVVTRFGVDTGTRRLVVADIAARRILRSEEAGSFVDAGFLGAHVLARFVLTSRGSIAWAVEATTRSTLEDVRVYAAPREGDAVLLESGIDIDASSLALSGSTLSWKRAATTHYAPMP